MPPMSTPKHYTLLIGLLYLAKCEWRKRRKEKLFENKMTSCMLLKLSGWSLTWNWRTERTSLGMSPYPGKSTGLWYPLWNYQANKNRLIVIWTGNAAEWTEENIKLSYQQKRKSPLINEFHISPATKKSAKEKAQTEIRWKEKLSEPDIGCL